MTATPREKARGAKLGTREGRKETIADATFHDFSTHRSGVI